MSSTINARYAVIGSPVAHSLSPVMQQAAFDALGIDAAYEALEAGRDDATAMLARLRAQGYAGWNVTTPLKDALVLLVDRLSDEAAQAHSVNTVRREADGSLSGHDTDGEGLVRALAELWSWRPHDGATLLLGAGPAARAIAAALRRHGATRLECWSRDAGRAAVVGDPARHVADLIVSTLPATACVPSHIVELAGAGTFVFDCNYRHPASPVRRMRALATSDGLPLLLHQGALSFEWWTGRPAPLAVMRAALGADKP